MFKNSTRGDNRAARIDRALRNDDTPLVMNDTPPTAAFECPPLACEDAVNAYLKDVDRTLIRENLKLTHAARVTKLMGVVRFLETTRGIAHRRSRP